MISISIVNTVLQFGNIIGIGGWAMILIGVKYYRRIRKYFDPDYTVEEKPKKKEQRKSYFVNPF